MCVVSLVFMGRRTPNREKLMTMDNWISHAMKDAGSCAMQHHLQIFETCCFLLNVVDALRHLSRVSTLQSVNSCTSTIDVTAAFAVGLRVLILLTELAVMYVLLRLFL